jgi:hypothetical protein
MKDSGSAHPKLYLSGASFFRRQTVTQERRRQWNAACGILPAIDRAGRA